METKGGLVKGKIKTCYISAPGDSSLASLRMALHERGISVVNPEPTYGGLQLAHELGTFLGRADLVIGILSRERRSDWTLFELGAAWSSKRQILLVVPPGAALIPPAGLSGVFVVRANPSNIDAIAFALDQLLLAPNEAKSPSSPRQMPPVGNFVVDLEAAAQEAIHANDGRALERVISLALEQAHLDGIANETSSREAKADFAVWVDELASTVGNPLLIEVKLQLSNATAMREAAAKLSSAVATSGTRFGLLLYGEGPSITRVGSSLPFNVLVLPIAEFLQSLRTQSFPAIVGHLRNQRVHGVDR